MRELFVFTHTMPYACPGSNSPVTLTCWSCSDGCICYALVRSRFLCLRRLKKKADSWAWDTDWLWTLRQNNYSNCRKNTYECRVLVWCISSTMETRHTVWFVKTACCQCPATTVFQMRRSPQHAPGNMTHNACFCKTPHYFIKSTHTCMFCPFGILDPHRLVAFFYSKAYLLR